jgi:cytochrome P450 monooxygenase
MGARICVNDTVFPHGGGPTGDSPIFVQAGTKVDMNFGVMQRDTDFWGPDAEDFRPERWQTVRPK